MATPRLFLCYAREDAAFCEGLVAALMSRGVDVLWDRALRPPMNYVDQIRGMIRAADSCAMVLTPASAASSECAAEIHEVHEQPPLRLEIERPRQLRNREPRDPR